jgi:tRNA (guanine-N7-)-methyltransferase
MAKPYQRPVRTYVLRGGRMSKLQQLSLEHLATQYCIPFRKKLIDMSGQFPHMESKPENLFIEIGFGKGIATADIAERNPENGYIGIEVFSAGVGKLLSELDRRSIKNLRLIQHDAVQVFQQMIPDGCLSGIHIFFPDPWPKRPHHKRRLIQPNIADLFERKLRINGYIYAVTDFEHYAAQILDVLAHTPNMSNPFEDGPFKGYSRPMKWRPESAFERKAKLKNHVIREIYFEKKAAAPK